MSQHGWEEASGSDTPSGRLCSALLRSPGSWLGAAGSPRLPRDPGVCPEPEAPSQPNPAPSSENATPCVLPTPHACCSRPTATAVSVWRGRLGGAARSAPQQGRAARAAARPHARGWDGGGQAVWGRRGTGHPSRGAWLPQPHPTPSPCASSPCCPHVLPPSCPCHHPVPCPRCSPAAREQHPEGGWSPCVYFFSSADLAHHFSPLAAERVSGGMSCFICKYILKSLINYFGHPKQVHR